jgi:L-iditol 2-dehydrogenase
LESSGTFYRPLVSLIVVIAHTFPGCRYANTYPAALALLSSGALDGVEKMITHRFPLSESAHAFHTMKKGVDEKGGLVVKVIVGSQ